MFAGCCNRTYCTLVLDAVLEEVGCRELVPNGHRVAKDDRLTDANCSTCQMVQRHRRVEDILLGKAHYVVRSSTHVHKATVLDDGRLG